MDPMYFTAERTGTASPPVFGVLYAEDFDEPREGAPAAEASPEPPPLTQADIDAACVAAVEAARAEWRSDQAQARRNVLALLESHLAAMREDVERTTQDMAENTVLTVLAMVRGFLPHFAREHGPAEVRALLGRLLPVIRSQQRIVVRVHPELTAAIASDLENLPDRQTAPIDVVAAPVERGDVTVTWENGSMTRDTRQIAQAIEDALGELGLHHAVEVPAKRMMAHA